MSKQAKPRKIRWRTAAVKGDVFSVEYRRLMARRPKLFPPKENLTSDERQKQMEVEGQIYDAVDDGMNAKDLMATRINKWGRPIFLTVAQVRAMRAWNTEMLDLIEMHEKQGALHEVPERPSTAQLNYDMMPEALTKKAGSSSES